MADSKEAVFQQGIIEPQVLAGACVSLQRTGLHKTVAYGQQARHTDEI